MNIYKKIFAVSFLIIFLFSFSNKVFSYSNTILIIESYHSQYEWDKSYIKGLRNKLGQNYKFVFFEMDTKRIPESSYRQQAELAWKTFQRIKPILVFLCDDNAFKLLAPKFETTDIPVIYLGINNNPRLIISGTWGLNRKFTGVLERPNYFRSIKYISSLLNARKIAVLFDAGETSKTIKSEVFNNNNSVIIDDVCVDLYSIKKFSQWKITVNGLKKGGYDAAIIGLYHTIVDEKGNHVSEQDIIYWTSTNIKVPPFGFWDFSIGRNRTIGGYIMSGEEQGLKAGEIALKILSGEEPSSIFPFYMENSRFLFSRSGLKKWRIILPENIRNSAFYTD
ncbi:MAG: hypothetical protein JW982_14275 [Spirochaetes bacterium]|nr:hypothetical protein [Spirochaetota bacterium]